MCFDSQTLSVNNSCHPRPESALIDTPTHLASSLKMALLNVRSLNNKTFIVNDTITSHQLDCILLTETWLNETGSKELIEASPSKFFNFTVFQI